MRMEFFSMARKYEPAEMVQFIDHACTVLDSVEEETTKCKQVIKLQKIMTLLKIIRKKATTIMFTANVGKLFSDMITCIVNGGIHEISDSWAGGGLFSFEDMTLMWSSLSGEEHMTTVAQAQDPISRCGRRKTCRMCTTR